MVATVKRDRELIETYANRIGRIDTMAFRIGVNPRLPVWAGNLVLLLGVLTGAVAIRLAFVMGSSLLKGLFLVAAGGIWTVAVHSPAHWIVGRGMGIRFTDYFIGGPPPPRPGIKTDYATYLRTSPNARAWMHASGAIATKLAPFVAIAFWPATGAPTWSLIVLLIMGGVQIVTDVTLSTKTSDWAKFKRERKIARTLTASALALVLLAAVACSSNDGGASGSMAASPKPSLAAVDPASRAEQLQAAVDEVMEAEQIPGVVAGVWTPAGSWTSATGDGGNGPLAVNDHFGIRSVTKSFVVTVLLQLAGEGKVSLDDHVADYVDDVRGGEEITLAELAGMTAGLADYTADQDFQQRLVDDFTADWTTKELLAYAFARPLAFEPGSAYSYSNTNTLVVGEVIEAVTGNALAKELQDRVFDPLELRNTAYHTQGSTVPKPASLGFLVEDGSEPQPVAVAFSAFGASGAMTSNLEDLHRWGEALGSGELLTPEMQAERVDRAEPATNGPRYDVYGLGMGQLNGWWGHTGSGLGYQAAVFRDPESGSVIVVELNSAPPGDAQADLFTALLAALG